MSLLPLRPPSCFWISCLSKNTGASCKRYCNTSLCASTTCRHDHAPHTSWEWLFLGERRLRPAYINKWPQFVTGTRLPGVLCKRPRWLHNSTYRRRYSIYRRVYSCNKTRQVPTLHSKESSRSSERSSEDLGGECGVYVMLSVLWSPVNTGDSESKHVIVGSPRSEQHQLTHTKYPNYIDINLQRGTK